MPMARVRAERGPQETLAEARQDRDHVDDQIADNLHGVDDDGPPRRSR
jgi:hypothetical protein